MSPERIDVQKAIGDPSRHFESPMDIVAHPALCAAEKAKLLRIWEVDARELEIAANENMLGGEPSRLSEVNEALRLVAERH